MADKTIKKLTYTDYSTNPATDYPVQVDSAMRDGDGRIISSSYLPITGGTLQGSLTLTGTNGITSNNIIFQDWKLGTARNASGKLYRYVGLDTNSTTGWLKTRAEADVITDLGIDLKAPLASPALTGTPTAPTATAGTNTTQIATTAFVATAVSAKAPNSHASSATTYGKGTSSLYGHLKMGESVNTALTDAQAKDTTVSQYGIQTFVNSSINALAAYYITKNAAGDPFATHAELAASTKVYSGGQERIPTRNDYCIVLADETNGNGDSTRYTYNSDSTTYSASNWAFQYVYNKQFTQAQINAMDSGITSSKVSNYDTHIDNSKIHVPVASAAGYLLTSANDAAPVWSTACYVSSNKLYSNSKEVVNLSDTQSLTNKTYNGVGLNGNNSGNITIAGLGTTLLTIPEDTGYTPAGACAKSVDTSISDASTSANLPTSAAVASFVEGKGYTTNTGTLTKTGNSSGNQVALWNGTDTVLKAVNQSALTPGVSIATDSGTNQLTLAHSTKYKITVGASTYIFTTPSDSNTDTLVKQTSQSSTTTTYPVLFSAQSSPSSGTAYEAKYSTACYLQSNHLYSNSKQVVNLSDSQALTNKTYNGYTLAAACAKAVTDSSSASAISTGTSLTTERDVYYGLPTINGAHNYTSSTTLFAPTSAGTSGQILKSAGSGAPSWADDPFSATDVPITEVD